MRIPWSMPDISGIFLVVLADNIKAMQPLRSADL
jgi:hypothetical protein